MTTTVLDTGAIDTAQAGPSALEFKDLAPSWRPPRLEFKTAAVLEPALSGDHTAAGSTLPGAQGLLGDLPGADQPLREVTAVVAVTGVRDEVGDTIVPGAFAQTLRERPRPKVCLGHDWNRPIGKTREIKELLPGDPGLPPTTYDGKPWPKEAGALLATFIPDPTKDGIDAYNSAKFYGPQESTYSIGYKTMAFDPDPQAARFLKQVAVYEYGPVLIPAHPLATLQGVKSADAEGIETKVSQVRDTAYWGEAYGTPITAHMHPHGPKARAERRSGRVPSREVGTMGANSPTKQAVGGEKIKPAQRAAQIEGTGLFAEPASDKRVLPHPTRASGKDQQHIDSLANEIAAGNADPDTPEDAHADIDKAVRGLLNEAITPAEVRQRLASHPIIDATGEQRNYQSGEPGSYDSDIDRVATDYAARYAALAHDQQRNAPEPIPANRFTDMSNAKLAGHHAVSSQILADLEKAGADPTNPGHQAAAANVTGAQAEMDARRSAAMGHSSVATAHARGVGYRAVAPEQAAQRAQEMQAQLDEVTKQQAEAPPRRGSVDERLPHRLQAMIHGLNGRNADGSERGPKEAAPAVPEPAAPTVTPTPAAPENVRQGVERMIEQGLPEQNPDRPYRLVHTGRGEATVDYQGNRYKVTRTGGVLAHVTVTDPNGHETSVPGGSTTMLERDRGPDTERAALAALARAHQHYSGASEPVVADKPKTRAVPIFAQAPNGVVHTMNSKAGYTHARFVRPPAESTKAGMDPWGVSWHKSEEAAANGPSQYKPANGWERHVAPVHGTEAAAAAHGPAMVRKHGGAKVVPDGTPATNLSAASAVETEEALPTDRPVPALDAEPALHANAIAAMEPDAVKTHLATLGGTKLDQIDAEMAQRAVALGKPGVVTRRHQMVKDAAATAEREPLSVPEASSALWNSASDRRAAMSAAGHSDQEIGRAVDEEARTLAAAQSSPRSVGGNEHTEAVRGLGHEFAAGRQSGYGAAAAEHEAGSLSEAQRADRADHAERAAAILANSGVAESGEPNVNSAHELGRYARGLRDPGEAQERRNLSAEGAPTPATAQITPQAADELAGVRDAALGLHEDEEGHLQVEPEVAARQDRVSSLLDRHAAGSLALDSAPTQQLHTHRQDLSEELRLQEELARRPAPMQTIATPKAARPSADRKAATQRPGLAGAAQDHAEALRAGNEDDVARTRARLESSVRRSRAGSSSARAIADHVAGGTVDASDLDRLAGSLRTEARTRRNSSAQARRTAKRLDRERIRSLLGSVDTELRNRGESPEVTATPGAPRPDSPTRRVTDAATEATPLRDEPIARRVTPTTPRLKGGQIQPGMRVVQRGNREPQWVTVGSANNLGGNLRELHTTEGDRSVVANNEFVQVHSRHAPDAPTDTAKATVTKAVPATTGTVPLTDQEYEAHIQRVGATLERELAAGHSTDVVHTHGGAGAVYTPERAQMHKDLVDYVWSRDGDHVPREGKSVLAGGLMGAGKSTVLGGHAGINTKDYLTLDPDALKAEFIKRGMVPQVEGLTPMEAAPLVHEESAHVAKMLARRAYQHRTNVIWDVSMSSTGSMDKRIRDMADHGYSRPDGVFVDIPVETSVERAAFRHRTGLEQFRAGKGNGGRYVPPAAIRERAHPSKSSANRHVFDQLADQFGSHVVFDNSTFGQKPRKVEGTGRWEDSTSRAGSATLGGVEAPKLTPNPAWNTPREMAGTLSEGERGELMSVSSGARKTYAKRRADGHGHAAALTLAKGQSLTDPSVPQSRVSMRDSLERQAVAATGDSGLYGAELHQEIDRAFQRVKSEKRSGRTGDTPTVRRLHALQGLLNATSLSPGTANLTDNPKTMSPTRLRAQIIALRGSTNPDDLKRLRALRRAAETRGIPLT